VFIFQQKPKPIIIDITTLPQQNLEFFKQTIKKHRATHLHQSITKNFGFINQNN